MMLTAAATSARAAAITTRRATQIHSKLSKGFQLRTMSSSDASFPVQASITSKLNGALDPLVLRVMNESHMHNVPKNSETHFKVVVVSNKFNDVKSLVKRHRMVNSILSEEIATEGPVHALSIVAKTPSQWENMVEKNEGEENVIIESSPSCRGGDGSLPKRR